MSVARMVLHVPSACQGIWVVFIFTWAFMTLHKYWGSVRKKQEKMDVEEAFHSVYCRIQRQPALH